MAVFPGKEPDALVAQTALDVGRTLVADDLHKLLADRRTIPCKVVMTIFWSEPYDSKTMQVPVKALLDVVNR